MSIENKSYAYKQFKKLRKERKMTEYQVAKATNNKVSTTVLSQWSRGDYDLKLDKLMALADAFGVPVTTFLEIKN